MLNQNDKGRNLSFSLYHLTILELEAYPAGVPVGLADPSFVVAAFSARI